MHYVCDGEIGRRPWQLSFAENHGTKGALSRKFIVELSVEKNERVGEGINQKYLNKIK